MHPSLHSATAGRGVAPGFRPVLVTLRAFSPRRLAARSSISAFIGRPDPPYCPASPYRPGPPYRSDPPYR